MIEDEQGGSAAMCDDKVVCRSLQAHLRNALE